MKEVRDEKATSKAVKKQTVKGGFVDIHFYIQSSLLHAVLLLFYV